MFINNIYFDNDNITIDCFDTQGRKMTIVLDGSTVSLRNEPDDYYISEITGPEGERAFRLEEK